MIQLIRNNQRIRKLEILVVSSGNGVIMEESPKLDASKELLRSRTPTSKLVLSYIFNRKHSNEKVTYGQY